MKEDKLVGLISYLGNAYEVLFKVSEGNILLKKL
jgi:hypothetical protein